MTNSKDKTIEVLGQERRRRWSVEEKLAMVRESLEPGQSVSVVARRNGINPNQLFHWRKLYQDGSLSAVSAGEAVVPASELADALKQIRELQRMLGKKTMEAEILKEAVEIARSRKWIAHSPVNVKRVYRVMRDHDLLLERRRKQPGVARRHEGRVAVDTSNTRWCSDGFEFRCEDGEKLRVTFALDCCDREAISWVASPTATVATMSAT